MAQMLHWPQHGPDMVQRCQRDEVQGAKHDIRGL